MGNNDKIFLVLGEIAASRSQFAYESTCQIVKIKYITGLGQDDTVVRQL